jgi:hypothetical protein
MKVILAILILVFSLFFLFILWMNVTPGHYRSFCCSVSYMEDKNARGICIDFCPPFTWRDKFLVKLSIIDFYK